MKRLINFLFKRYQLGDCFYSKKEVISIIKDQERFLNENIFSKEENVNIIEFFLKSKNKERILHYIDKLQDLIWSYEFYEDCVYRDYSFDYRIINEDVFLNEYEKEKMREEIDDFIVTSEKKLREIKHETKEYVFNNLSIV